jgi:Zn-dependent M28 family amino/carboxypeptidase
VWHEGDKAAGGYALPAAWMPASGLARLLAGSGHSAEEIFAAAPKGALKPFPLRQLGRLRVAARVREFTSENVAGVLRGERADEYVAISAHLDHLGIGPPIGGDAIYNGAVDDASGVSAMIEIARAFAALPHRPARSILVLGFTAEEKYLQGAEYFTRHATVPLAAIVADVNLDSMNGLRREPHDLVPIGAEHSTLMAAVRAAAAAQSLRISPDPQPNQVFFIRADQYRFVRQGIPAVFPCVGWQDAQGNIDKGKADDEWWEKNRYHKPSDEWDPKADYESLAKEVRADFLLALAIALDEERPRWNEGDVFGKLFAHPAR